MEIFKFNPGSSATVLEDGEMVTGYKSVMWAERYREPGEFELVAFLSSGLKEFLPPGTLLSHTNTFEVMIVENAEIAEDQDSNPVVKITGRSFVSFLEHRIVGTAYARSSPYLTQYVLAEEYTWVQAVQLINQHVNSFFGTGTDALVNVEAVNLVSGTSIQEERNISYGPVLPRLLDILAIDDLGVKTIRRSTFDDSDGSSAVTLIAVYVGESKTDSVIFTWDAGEFENVSYLFTNKRYKNSAVVRGRWINTVVDLGPTNYERRMMLVDATDIDEGFADPPIGGDVGILQGLMATRGRQALMSQREVALTSADLSKITTYQYRKDYNLGDLVTLIGNFDETAVMRITEYVEIQDETGESGHPTLELPGA